MADVLSFKVTYMDCEGRIWRELQISSNAYLCQLGYAVLATFDTMAYHLFSITHKGISYELPNEDFEVKRDQSLFCVKLSDLTLSVGDKLEMIYDFGCQQFFSVEVTSIFPMPKGTGRAYPKIIAGEGFGIVDDLSADELLDIIHAIDADGNSSFYYDGKRPDIPWDYRDYDFRIDNMLLKGEIEGIADGYSAFEAYQ